MKQAYELGIDRVSGFGLNLCLVEKDDLSELLQWRNDPIISSFTPKAEKVSKKMFNFWFAKARLSDNIYPYIIYENNNKVGYFELTDIKYNKKICFNGFFLRREYIGRKIGLKLSFLREKICKKLSINIIFSEIHIDNKRSIKFHEATGFRKVKPIGENFYLWDSTCASRKEKLSKLISIFNFYDEWTTLWSDYSTN